MAGMKDDTLAFLLAADCQRNFIAAQNEHRPDVFDEYVEAVFMVFKGAGIDDPIAFVNGDPVLADAIKQDMNFSVLLREGPSYLEENIQHAALVDVLGLEDYPNDLVLDAVYNTIKGIGYPNPIEALRDTVALNRAAGRYVDAVTGGEGSSSSPLMSFQSEVSKVAQLEVEGVEIVARDNGDGTLCYDMSGLGQTHEAMFGEVVVGSIANAGVFDPEIIEQIEKQMSGMKPGDVIHVSSGGVVVVAQASVSEPTPVKLGEDASLFEPEQPIKDPSNSFVGLGGDHAVECVGYEHLRGVCEAGAFTWDVKIPTVAVPDAIDPPASHLSEPFSDIARADATAMGLRPDSTGAPNVMSESQPSSMEAVQMALDTTAPAFGGSSFA